MKVEESLSGQIVRVELEARACEWEIAPGLVVDGYGFNGQVPGPTIEGNVGDTLVVHLKNALPEPTTIHWHGLRVPADMDGTEMVQRPIAPGGEFEYRFTLPDAGTFWYHPHLNETVQLEKGLYGPLIVRGPDEPTLDRERVLLFDDVKLNRRGDFARFGGWIQRHNGRQGNVRLVNGKTDASWEMGARQIERWRVLNCASSTYVRLSIGGRTFTILGTDGGLLEHAQPVTEALIAPADRMDLAVGPFEEGATFAVEALPYARGMVKERGGTFAKVRVTAEEPSVAAIPARLRTIQPLARPDATPSRTIELSGQRSLKRGVDWHINHEAHHHDSPVRVGELQVWDVVNASKMDHPFHLHGFFFQVLQENGHPRLPISWEDTINVPAQGQVRIAWIADDRPGSWMYHCHILEHHAAGMMAHFDVVR
ncbi:MAG: multicopper oxidase family protein [Actinomycetota bacterium]|nr:multicopper oxidase family protein [Actinomycetota bacterium]